MKTLRLQVSIRLKYKRSLKFLNHPELKDIFIVAADYSAGVLCRIAIDKYLSGIQEDLTNLEPLYLQKFAGV